jgi:integrase/recombinase XerD
MAKQARKADGGGRLIALFLDMLSAERGAAANTIEAYRRDLEDLAGHLTAKGIGILNAATTDLRSYVAGLGGRGLAASSQARRLSALRQLYRFLYAE